MIDFSAADKLAAIINEALRPAMYICIGQISGAADELEFYSE